MDKATMVLYDRIEPAQAAVQALRDAGFKREQISMVLNDPSGQYTSRIPTGPQEQSTLYVEGLRRGGVLVVFEGDDAETARAQEILEQYEPVDLERQAKIWQAGGWGGFDVDPAPEQTRSFGATPEASQNPADVRPMSDEEMGYLENVFRNYYHNSRNSLKYKYEECRPTYIYGHVLRADPRFENRTWEEIEPLVREEWEAKRCPGSWEDFRESVRNIWEGNLEERR